MGLFCVDRDGQIVGFEEKPTPIACRKSVAACRRVDRSTP